MHSCEKQTDLTNEVETSTDTSRGGNLFSMSAPSADFCPNKKVSRQRACLNKDNGAACRETPRVFSRQFAAAERPSIAACATMRLCTRTSRPVWERLTPLYSHVTPRDAITLRGDATCDAGSHRHLIWSRKHFLTSGFTKRHNSFRERHASKRCVAWLISGGLRSQG